MAAEVKSFKEFTNNVQSYVTKISRNSKLMTQGGELFFMATVASFIGFIMLYISFSVAKLNNFDLSLLNAINYLGLGLIIYGTINAIIGLVFKLFYVLSKNNPY
jgi:tetrahydromethanopterin S-methyltransferase subunit F